ncbi:MAG: methyltransferase domain-containing protein [Lachnospiraceae bacterium]|nr:methyltransferase domain-containing protein [Lachnospiraceae bacterium]
MINIKDIEAQAAFWDAKAKPCSAYERRSEYADEFLRRSGLQPGETVFDMGCGSGTLCLPLADDGHKVFCADLSEKMLQSVRDVIEEEGISLLSLKKLSWQEDWDQYDLPVCDLAFASRSMFGVDPANCAAKLSGRAKRRVCISLPVNSDKFTDPGSPYDLSGRNLNAFAKQCIDAVRKLGFTPVLEYMDHGMKDGIPTWAFIRWDV